MPGVTTAYQAGVHGSLPAAGSGCILYACSTHAKVYRSDGTTWTDWLVISAGMTNPLTTTGDLIYSSSGTTPARLAVGGANTVLHGGASVPAYSAVVEGDLSTSDITTANVTTAKHGFAPKLPNDATKYLDGTGAYTVPAGGGGSLTTAYAELASNQSISNDTPTDVTGCAITLAAGTWMIWGQMCMVGSGSQYIMAWITTGSSGAGTPIAQAEDTVDVANRGTVSIMPKYVVLGSSTDYHLVAQGNGSPTVQSNPNSNGKATFIGALKVA